MARPAKYRNADDLIRHTTPYDGCFNWHESTMPTPVISPFNPLAQTLHTNSIPRILFILCRHLPASTRLVRRCKSPLCVNPYHYTEAGKVLKQRTALALEGKDPHGLLPHQESTRHIKYPDDEVIDALRPVVPEHLAMLAVSANMAGFDGKKIDVRLPDPDVPVLVLKKREAPPSTEKHSEDEEMDSFFDLIERSLDRT